MGRSVRNKLRGGGSSNSHKKQRSARNRPAPDPAKMASRAEDPPAGAQGEPENSQALKDTPPAPIGSELSALLKGENQPENPDETPALGVSGEEEDAGKRSRDLDGLEKTVQKPDGPPEKKPKRAVLNSEGVRGIVREENGFLMAETETKLRAMVREEFWAALGITESNATLKGALAEIYTASARTLIEEALQKLKFNGPLETPSSSVAAQPPVYDNWAEIGRLSVIEGTLNSLEVLCKTRADSDSLRKARNILMDVKGAVEGLKVTGTNLDHKTDTLRSMLASLPVSQPHNVVQQPFMQPPFASPWNPQFLPQSNPGPQGNPAASPPNPSFGVSIPTAVLRGVGFPDVALEAPDKYFVIKPKSGETIRTFKAIFPDNPGKRAGFLRVADSEHVARKLADACIEIGDWRPQEEIQAEQGNR
ncbi:hypothetical protein KFL_005190120 [Klebsormidium nitens]|uniref:Uncharacterized protein n=1 Tax=Klebsormidium nitens TaxID=105231 RepID=A0A1Y1IJ08_KLENI|nr:hypothetical protein KFL_005190120 [Klebsormidium nitens]|eukprot:GAQ89419.1 hypothetical protein KFL_005190120 [Klebsormidium nitens]